MKILITGGAGFIGSNLADWMLSDDHEVIVLDNMSSGKDDFIKHNLDKENFSFHKTDLLKDDIAGHFHGVDEVWHLAANPDVRVLNPNVHAEQNFIATKNVLDAMRKSDAKKIMFTSSSTVYGEALSAENKKATDESHATNPISFYGAAKLASEAFIQAYCHAYGMQCCLFRLANVIGPRSTHGIIFDFIQKLRKNPKELEILGNGMQRKSYIYVDDCIDAMILASRKGEEKTGIFNIGTDDWTDVKTIATVVCEKMNLKPELKFTGTERGWVGDVTLMILDTKKIKSLGFNPIYNSRMAVEKTTEILLKELKF